MAGGEHRHGRIVGVKHAACHGVPPDSFRQRLYQPCRFANPIGQCCAVEFDAVAGINLRLPVKRQMIAKLRDQHVSQKARARLAARDRQGRHRRLRHGLAFAAGIGRPHMADHLEPAGNVVKDLGHILAHLAHSAAASRA